MAYRGPFPKTEEDRVWLRRQALRQLERLQIQLQEAHQRFREHGTTVGLSFFREQYNDSVEKLIVANAGCATHDDMAPDPPLTANTSYHPPFYVALRQLFDQVTLVMTKCLKFWTATGEALRTSLTPT
jgi:hypothetical protein